MERSDTVPDVLTAPKEELPVREDIGGESVMDRMMRMCLSLRAELYDLYKKHQALLDENKELKITVKGKDALCDSAVGHEEPVLGGDEGDREAALLLPTVQDAGEAATESVVSPRPPVRDGTPVPNSPKFPLHPCDFRPLSPSEHGLACCPPNEESEQP